MAKGDKMNTQNLLTAPLKWYKELPRYLTRPGWREDDSDKPIAGRSKKIKVSYAIRVSNQTKREVMVAEAEGLIPRDIEACTLERLLGYSKQDFSEVQDPGRNAYIRTLRGSLLRQELMLEIAYPQGEKETKAVIVATYGDLGNIQNVQDIVQKLLRLEADGEIDLQQR